MDKTDDNLDFGQLYRLAAARSHFQQLPSTFWGERASKFTRPVGGYSSFSTQLVPKLQAALEDSSSVLDVGCGSGDLLALLAESRYGLGIDASPEMVKLAKERHPDSLEFKCMSFTDDWTSLPDTDAVIAIRSLQTDNMETSLRKLLDKAKKVCVVVTRCTSHISDQAAALLPFALKPLPPVALLFGLVEQTGLFPHVDYVETTREWLLTTASEREGFIHDVVKRVNGHEWSPRDLEAFSDNVTKLAEKQDTLTCRHRWAVLTVRKHTL